jgi:hypothetical protein
MSRSFRKTPITGNTTCRSDKEYKRDARKRWRRRCHQIVGAAVEEDLDLPTLKETSNEWAFGKDGKHYFGHLLRHADEWLRERARRLMRK